LFIKGILEYDNRNCFKKYGAGKGDFKNPADVCLDDKGCIVVTDEGYHRIEKCCHKKENLFPYLERTQ